MTSKSVFHTVYRFKKCPAPAHRAFRGATADVLRRGGLLLHTLRAPQAAALARSLPGDWGTPVVVASALGRGRDNPTDPYNLTATQMRRSVLALFEGVSFQLRYMVAECCGTSRNFLFGGYSNLQRPLCAPPSAPPCFVADGHCDDGGRHRSPQSVQS